MALILYVMMRRSVLGLDMLGSLRKLELLKRWNHKIFPLMKNKVEKLEKINKVVIPLVCVVFHEPV